MPRAKNYRATARKVEELAAKNDSWHESCINLIASENVTSPAVRRLLGSDFTHRYADYERHDIRKRYDDGSGLMIEVEEIATRLAKQLFGAKFAELRPISGHMAVIACILGHLTPGGKTLEVSSPNGGHEYYYLAKNIAAVNYTPEWLPFDVEEWNIDLDAAKRKVRSTKPDVIVLGSSVYLFPHPTAEIREVADETGAKVVYDGAHVMGLIAGGVWPNPLANGAHLLSGSTHKTLPGPQKGIILANDEKVLRPVQDALYPALMTNHHLMNVAALTYAMAEFLEFGKRYAAQVVKNSVALAQALSEDGFDVIGAKKGFTRSHQVLVRTSSMIPGSLAAKQLASAGVLCNKTPLGATTDGLRIGVSEVTRVGMKTSEMKEVARIIGNILIRKKDPKSVASKVRDLTKDFGTIQFSFEQGRRAYTRE